MRRFDLAAVILGVAVFSGRTGAKADRHGGVYTPPTSLGAYGQKDLLLP
jgi:hypothetical protein